MSCIVTVTAVNLSGVFSLMPLSSEYSFTTLIMSCLPEFLTGFLSLMCLKKDLSLCSASCTSDFFVCFACLAVLLHSIYQSLWSVELFFLFGLGFSFFEGNLTPSLLF